MNFEAIEQEIVTWDDAKLRKLQALVVMLRIKRDDPNFLEKMSQRMDEPSPERWVTVEDFERRVEIASDCDAKHRRAR